MRISDSTLVLIALEEYFRRERHGSEICAKQPYTSDEAKRALAQVRHKRRIKPTAERRTYKCRRCGYYHLTSHSK